MSDKIKEDLKFWLPLLMPLILSSVAFISAVSVAQNNIDENYKSIEKLENTKVDKEYIELFIQEYRRNEDKKQNQLDRIESAIR